nr:uncharacterized protein LOC129267910 [Lytechinus pictus]
MLEGDLRRNTERSEPLPVVICAIDGTRVYIRSPVGEQALYFLNRKNSNESAYLSLIHSETGPISNDHILESRDDIGDDEDTTAGSIERDRYPPHSHSKRIHSESSDDTKDDKEATEESVDLMDARPRKRRAKTDQNPTSP